MKATVDQAKRSISAVNAGVWAPWSPLGWSWYARNGCIRFLFPNYMCMDGKKPSKEHFLIVARANVSLTPNMK